MNLKKRLNELAKKIKPSEKYISPSITSRATHTAVYSIQKDLEKIEGVIPKDYTDKFYEAGKKVCREGLNDVDGITKEDVERLGKQIDHAYIEKRLKNTPLQF